MDESQVAPRESRPTKVLKIVTVVTGLIAQIIVGLIFMGSGIAATRIGLIKEKHTLVTGGIVAALLGAMCLPSMFEVFSKIYDKFFPEGIPFLPFTRRKAKEPTNE